MQAFFAPCADYADHIEYVAGLKYCLLRMMEDANYYDMLDDYVHADAQ